MSTFTCVKQLNMKKRIEAALLTTYVLNLKIQYKYKKLRENQL